MRDKEWLEFSNNLYSPRMPMLETAAAEARDLLSSMMSGARSSGKRSRTLSRLSPAVLDEVWEALCTRLDAMDMLDTNGKRWFAPYIPLRWMRESDRREPGAEGAPRAISTRPLNVETMIALLSMDPDTVSSVELIATEAAERMVPWGVQKATRVVWTIEDAFLPVQKIGSSVFSWPIVAAACRMSDDYGSLYQLGDNPRGEALRCAEALEAFGDLASLDRTRRNLSPPTSSPLHVADSSASGWCWWRIASSLRREVPLPRSDQLMWREAQSYPRMMTGRMFCDLPDVLDASLRIWNLGCQLLDVRGDAVIIRLPIRFLPVTTATFDELRLASTQLHRSELVTSHPPMLRIPQLSL